MPTRPSFSGRITLRRPRLSPADLVVGALVPPAGAAAITASGTGSPATPTTSTTTTVPPASSTTTTTVPSTSTTTATGTTDHNQHDDHRTGKFKQ
jgi:hypothetical protein